METTLLVYKDGTKVQLYLNSKKLQLTDIQKTNLEECIISDEIDEISNTFTFCWTLKKVVLSNKIKHINRWCFGGCSRLETVIIGENIESIEEYGFYGCNSLKNINIPKSLKNIGNKCFDGCESLPQDTKKELIKIIKKNNIQNLFNL